MKKTCLVLLMSCSFVLAQDVPCFMKWAYPTQEKSNTISFNIRQYFTNGLYSSWPLVLNTTTNQVRISVSNQKLYSLFVTNAYSGLETPCSWTIPISMDFNVR